MANQLINLWFDVTDLNNKQQHSHHLTVPATAPLSTEDNVLNLLTLCLLPESFLDQKPIVQPEHRKLIPEIAVADEVYGGLDKLWIYTRELTPQQLNRVQHKCKKLLMASKDDSAFTDGQEHSNDATCYFRYSSDFIRNLTHTIHKTTHWHIFLEQDNISISDDEHYFEGQWHSEGELLSV